MDPTNEELILVPVDFSEHSRAALVWAIRHARLLGGGVLALHVVHEPEEVPGFAARRARASGHDPEAVALGMLDEFAAEAREAASAAGVDVRTSCVTGIPATRILEVAAAEGATQIAMGGSGRTAIGRLLLGSVAAKVAHLARVPVTIVKAPGRPA